MKGYCADSSLNLCSKCVHFALIANIYERFFELKWLSAIGMHFRFVTWVTDEIETVTGWILKGKNRNNLMTVINKAICTTLATLNAFKSLLISCVIKFGWKYFSRWTQIFLNKKPLKFKHFCKKKTSSKPANSSNTAQTHRVSDRKWL